MSMIEDENRMEVDGNGDVAGPGVAGKKISRSSDKSSSSFDESEDEFFEAQEVGYEHKWQMVWFLKCLNFSVFLSVFNK